MIPKQGITIPYLKKAIMRRFWYVIIPFFVFATGAAFYCIRAPKIFRSSTLILVQPQEIPTDYVQSTVSANANLRLTTLREQVMSRPQLENLIKQYDLYPEVRLSGTMSDAVGIMRRNIFVEVNESGEGREASAASFQISFDGTDPLKVQKTTTAIANLFIKDNLKLREKQATGTSKFLERELSGR